MKGFLLLLLIALAVGGEDHRHDEVLREIPMNEEAVRELGIELDTVRKSPAVKVIRMPAEVRENPLLSFSVYSPVRGIVRRIYVKEGDFVRKGQPVAEVYSPELANLIGELRIAEVRMETARKVYERDRKLYKEQVIQYTRFFNSMIEYERAKGEYEALRERLKSFGEIKGYHLVLRSPGTGYIVDQNVVLGESVGPERELFKIHSHEVLWIYGWADEESARSVREGMEGRVVHGGLNQTCRIDFVGHEVDRKTRRVRVRCVAENRDHRLKPGMFVRLEVRTGGETAILIPKSAVQEVEGKKVAFVWKGDHFEPREVHVEKEIDGYYVISEGLKEGERIAVSGTVFLKTKLVGVEEAGHVH
ncbi:MAG: efflux RND transporter periplasmic adaptor subunit [Aquificota bacterium]|nr:efflux RND transporter periplasmic adaptor subunit [Aquificota bacterium]